MNSKKGRGKRFLAGFLALLMAVTLLPVNAAGVAYAEELDAIETEAPDSVIAADEETEAAGSVVAADEETEEPQVNEGESSEEVEPEEGLTADEEDVALEEAVPELEAAVAVASEEVLEPAEVSAVTDTNGYTQIGTGKTWEFTTANYDTWNIKSNRSLTEDDDLDGIKVNAGSTDEKVKSKYADGQLSIDAGGIIDIPVDNDADAIVIEITLSGTGGNNNERGIVIGTGSKQDTVYHKGSDSDKHYFSSKFYSNADLYKKTDGVFSTVLSIAGIGGETKITTIVLKEYQEVVDPVALDGATVDLSVGEGDDKAYTAVYTGEPIDLNVVVTKTGETTPVNPKAYTKSFLREGDTEDVYDTATKDLTSAGKIKVKVTSIHENADDRSDAVSNVFEIKKATLVKSDKEISIDSGKIAEYKSAELDLTTLIKPLSEEDTFAYTLDTEESNGYVAGDVVDGTPVIADGKLTYVVNQSATAASAATDLVVKVTSTNYEDAYIKVTVSIADKTAVTVSGNSVTHTYNGAAYGFKEKATFTLTGVTGDALNTAMEDIKENLTYTFTKVVNGEPDASTETTSEPTTAGVYKVTAKLLNDSDYTMTDYCEDKDVERGYVTLTIAPKTVTIKPNDTKWDKTINPDYPTPPATVTSANYTFVGDGLVAGDSISTPPTIKYYKHVTTEEETATEMAEADWATLDNGDVVDIVASGADAGSNYKIEYAAGTLTVLVRTVTPITALTAKKSTFLASDITADVAGNKLVDNGVDGNGGALKLVKGDVLVNGFLVTGDADNYVTWNEKSLKGGSPEANYTARIKSGSSGNQYYKSIGFTIDKAATLYIVGSSDAGSTKRAMALYKLNTNNQLAECVGTKYSIDTTNDLTYAAYNASGTTEAEKGGIFLTGSNGSATNYINIELTEAGTYYLAAAESGICFYEVTVTYKDDVDPNPDYNITIDQSKVATGGATVAEGDKKTAKANETVALADVVTVTVNTGFELKGYEVTAGGETVTVSADNTFTMPASNVTVTPIVMAEGAVVAPVATPGSTTQTTEVEKGSKVTLSVAGGDFDHIYYTTGATATAAADPKDASADRKDYAVDSPDGIVINEDVTIKAVATKGENFSDVVTYSYTAKETQTPGTVELKSVKISGTPRVGNTLTANATFEGTPDPSKVSYAWSRVSSTGTETPVGTNSKTYEVAEADLNCSIKVVVTFTNAEGQPVTKTDSVAVTESNLKGEGIEIEFDDGTTYIYTGAKITPSITVYNNGTPLVEGTDYTVKYTNNINASHKVDTDGKLAATVTNSKKLPTVTVVGKGSLSKTIPATFEIVPKALDTKDDYASAANEVPEVKADAVVVLSGKAATPVLLYGGTKLAVKKNFTYKNQDDQKKKTWAEGDTLELEGANNFTGAITLNVHVVDAAAQKDAKISAKFVADKATLNNLCYTGGEITPDIEVSTKTKTATELTAGTDYVISYPSDKINVGSKKVIISGISQNCIGTVTLSYKIKPADKNGGTFVVTGVKTGGYDYVSTGVTFKLTGDDPDVVTVKYQANTADDSRAVSADGESLVPGKDFKITYSNNKKAGDTAKYTVTGLGNYKGVVLKNQPFTINPIKLIDGNTDVEVKVTVADVLYNKAAVYKSVPYVTVNGALLKASEYDVHYVIGTGDDASDTIGKTRKITDEDVANGPLDVTVKIVPKAKSKNVAGPADGGAETALTGGFKIIKSTDTLTFTKDKDLSKAKITFYGTSDAKSKNKVGFTGEPVYPTRMEVKLNGVKEPLSLDLAADGQLKEADKTTYGFTLTYADNAAKGKATVVVTADGTNYVGGKSATFNIVAKALDSLDTEHGEGFITSFMKGLFNK